MVFVFAPACAVRTNVELRARDAVHLSHTEGDTYTLYFFARSLFETIIEGYFIGIDVYLFWGAWRVSSLRKTGVSNLSRLAGHVQMRAHAPRNYMSVGLQVPPRSSF